MTPDELQNRREIRQFWERIIILVLAAIPNFMNLYMGYLSGDRLVSADAARARIEEKIDTNHAAATEAVEHAKEAATEVKTAVAEVKAITDTMGKGSP